MTWGPDFVVAGRYRLEKKLGSGETTFRGAKMTRPMLLLAGAALAFACSFDRGDRWLKEPGSGPPGPACTAGERRCALSLERCVDGANGPAWVTDDDCPEQGLVCAPRLLRCAACDPDETRCTGTDVERCAADGSGYAPDQTCPTDKGVSCRNGGCVNLCTLAADQRSNVGCEYWAVDLDNADIDDALNAAAQQFAVVVSNPQPDLAATVTVEQDDTSPGTENAPAEVARAIVPPFSLRVFKLGPREVDGSPPGEFNSGTHTALTRAAYRVRSTVPVVVYQMNPLENTNVFSNDASLLKPTEALRTDGGFQPAYVVLGWPQTIASTDDPDTNFSAQNPLDLRAFLTLVGTVPDTRVRITTTARILGGGPIPETPAGDTFEITLGAFDVANLETDDFNADFTGSIIEADQALAVFSGGEASDAPWFTRIGDRQCCADHLEEQLDPVRTAGKKFVASVSPNRSTALAGAGATGLERIDAPEYFRVAAATRAGAVIRTTLPAPSNRIVLDGLGDWAEITAVADFYLESTEPISLASISPSQGAAGIPRGLPGGDPSLLVIPPIEQFRANYVLLTPDRYSFDFLRIVTPADAEVRLDGDRVDRIPTCERAEVAALATDEEPFVVYRCQLSFPVIDMSSAAIQLLSPGLQNDGVHEIVASRKVGVLVDGFDRNVSYAYAGGTELVEIVAR